MEVTLADLLLSNFLKEAKVLAGEKGLSKKVTSVTVLDSPDAYKYMRGGEFVVTTAYSILHDEDMQTRVIENLSKNGAAGLGIKLRFFKHKLPEKLKKKADEIGFAIISIPDEYAYIDILEFVMLNMVSELTKEVKRIDEVYKEINKSISDEGLDGVAKTLYKWTGLPTVINFDQETYSYPVFELPPKFPKDHNKWNVKYSKFNAAGAVNCYVWENENTEYEWLSTQVVLDNNSTGHILMFKNKRGFNKTDCIILDYAASACSMEMQRIKSLKNVKRKYKKEFLLQVMNGEYSYKDAFYQASQLDFNLSKGKLTIAVVYSDFLKDFHLNIEKIDNAVIKIFEDNALSGLFDNNFVLLLNENVEKDSKPLERLYYELKDVFEYKDYFIGVGRSVDFNNLYKSYDEAVKAVRIGLCIGSTSNIYYFKDLGFYRLLNLPQINEEIELFYKEYLETIVEYDKQNNANLVETLQMYINSGYNYRDTAKQLYVHPNTVKYRISLIEKLFKKDFKSPDTRLNIAIALKLYPFIRKNI